MSGLVLPCGCKWTPGIDLPTTECDEHRSDPHLAHQRTKEIAMETTWRVEQVIAKPGVVQATLQRVEWFKKNPDFDAAMADESEEQLPEEFLDALPGDEGADTIDVGGTLTLDVTDGPDLHPLDNVRITLTVLTPVEV